MPGLMFKKIIALTLIISTGLFSCGLISGCKYIYQDAPVITIEEPKIPLTHFNPTFVIPVPDTPGLFFEKNDRAFIDYSNMHLGYITVGFLEDTDNDLKVLIYTPGNKEYIYDLKPLVIEVFPLSEGDGIYTIGVYEHLEGNMYEEVLIITIDVVLINEFVPFIHPNQYVDYCEDSPAAGKALELYIVNNTFFDTVEAIYNFIIENIKYDFDLADTIGFGYLPDMREILEQGGGICLDIAALLTAMLRSQGIPAKLVFGNYNDPGLGVIYHAWVSVYSEEDGMIGDYISIKGGTWNILDPLFTSGSPFNASVNLPDNQKNYQAEFYY